MAVTQQDASAVAVVLSGAKRILCVCHRNPDGDAAGSVLGMTLLLRAAFPSAVVSAHAVDPAPENLQFLPGATSILPPPPVQEGNVFVFLDCAEPKLTEMEATHPTLFAPGHPPSVVIDHHPSNPRFGTANIVIPEASSTCEIVTNLADVLQWPMHADAATCLLTGIYTDTGGLLHSNTAPAVYRVIARLLRGGARHQEVITSVYRSAKLSTLKLWGRVLEKISVSREGGVVSAVTEGDFRATGADYSELTGAIDYVNAVPGVRFSLVLSERGGKVKGSLRTQRDDVDVAAMAGKFSGGGHTKAAGFALPGKLQPEVRWTVVDGMKNAE
jgi:phosphoesterase RecJ-like protein